MSKLKNIAIAIGLISFFQQDSEAYNVTVLCTSEVLGRILPVDGWLLECDFQPRVGDNCEGSNALNCEIYPPYGVRNNMCHPCTGGYTAFAAYSEQARIESDTVVTLDPGNFYFGTDYGAVDDYVSMNNILESVVFHNDTSRPSEPLFDAMGVGVADFGQGADHFVKVLQSSSIPRVTSNYDFSKNEKLSQCVNKIGAPCLSEYTIIVKGGKKIGILGATTRRIPSFVSLPNFVEKFEGNSIKSVEYVKAKMLKENPDVNCVILLSSLSTDENDAIATRVAGISVIVGIKTPIVMELPWTGEIRTNPDYFVDANNPRAVTNALSATTTYIISARSHGRGMGRIDLWIDDTENTILGIDENKAGDVDLLVEFDSDYNPTYTGLSINATMPIVKELVGKQILKAKDAVGTITRKLYGHWGDGNDRGQLPDYRGLGCRFPTKLFTENDVCPADTKVIPFFLQPQESPTRQACCPFKSGERECVSEQCQPDVDPITNEWSYPKSDGVNIDACCKYNPYNNGVTNRGCCPMDIHWDVSGCRNSDCPFGRVMTDALMVACKDCDMVFSNGGSIRGNLEGATEESPKDVSISDLNKVFSFSNSFSTFRIQAQVLVEVIRHAVNQYQSYYGGNYMHVGGARFVFHAGLAQLFRLELCSDWNRDFDRCDGTWEDAMNDPTKLIKVGTNNYLREGESDYTMLGDDSSNLVDVNDYGAKIYNYVGQYLQIRSPFTPPTMESIKEACGGYIHNYVEHWRLHPECRSLKAAIEFPETCSRNSESEQACLVADKEEGDGLLFDGLKAKRLNGTSCFQCSGFGICNTAAGYQCNCVPVQIEGYAYPQQYKVFGEDKDSAERSTVCETLIDSPGIPFMKGESCETPRTRVAGTPIGGAVGFTSGFACFIASGLALWQVVTHRSHVITRYSLGDMTVLMTLGGFVAGLFCIVSSTEPTSSSCTALPFLASLAFGLLIGPMAVKFYFAESMTLRKRRRRKNQTNKTGSSVESSETDDVIGTLFSRKVGYLIVFLVVGFELLLTGIFTGIAPIRPTIVVLDESVVEWSVTLTCDSQDAFGNDLIPIWLIGLVGFNSVIAVYTAYNALSIMSDKSIPIQEARYLSFAVYNIILVCSITIPLNVMSAPNPQLQAVLRELCATMVVCIAMGCMFVAKRGPFNKLSGGETITGLLTGTYPGSEHSYGQTADLNHLSPYSSHASSLGRVRRGKKGHDSSTNEEGSYNSSSHQYTSAGL